MSNFSNTELERINKAIADGEILHATVKRLGNDEDTSYMEVDLGGNELMQNVHAGRITLEESDAEMDRRSLLPLLNTSIPLVILGIDEENDRLICSRKQAQIAIKKSLEPQLRSGEPMVGRIAKLTHFGAFVEIQGISGILRTPDFSTDHSEVEEYYKVGDRIEVCCSGIDELGRISFRAKELHTRKVPLRCDITEGQVTVGRVRSLHTFQRGPVAFVRIAQGIDCLCRQPEDMEIDRGVEVGVLVQRITPNEENPCAAPHVSGRIIRVF